MFKNFSYSSPFQGRGSQSRLSGSPVVKWLLIINISIWLLDKIIGFKLQDIGHFSIATAIENLQIWRFVTFQFLHSHEMLMHILFNMFALYMFGTFVERWWGSRKFLIFYLLCGCAGALFYTLLFYLGVFGNSPINLENGETISRSVIPLVGASAGIYGCLIAVAVIAPNLQVMLIFPPIPMKMKTFAIGILVIGVLITFNNWNNAGGEAGHLGGAILAFILMKYPHLLNFVDHFGSDTKKKKRVVDAQIIREKKIRPRTKINFEDSEIDAILDKVNREGIQSLTEEEKEFLRHHAGD